VRNNGNWELTAEQHLLCFYAAQHDLWGYWEEAEHKKEGAPQGRWVECSSEHPKAWPDINRAIERMCSCPPGYVERLKASNASWERAYGQAARLAP
jgi:hypothetical protein